MVSGPHGLLRPGVSAAGPGPHPSGLPAGAAVQQVHPPGGGLHLPASGHHLPLVSLCHCHCHC